MGIVLVGLALRLLFFWLDRSLWLDEALVSLNIVQRDYLGLLDPLEGDQAAPPFSLWLSKLCVMLVGPSEHALRFPALLASVISLLCFPALAKRLLPPAGVAIALACFAFLPACVLYAAEVKPYALDCCAAVLLSLLALRHDQAPSRASWIALLLAGIVAPWFSYASVFVLAGIGIVMLVKAWPTGQPGRFRVIGLGSCWALSFFGLWLLVASETAANENFAHYWKSAFLPFPPTSPRDLGLLVSGFFGFFEAPFATRYFHPSGDFTPLVAGLAAFLAVFGSLAPGREMAGGLRFLIAPVLAAALASALGLYPFTGRFLLVFAPAVALLIGTGCQALLLPEVRHSPGSAVRFTALLRNLAAPGLVLLLAALASSQLFVRPQGAVQTRQAVRHLATQMEPGDTLLVHMRSLASLLFYEETDPACALPEHRRILVAEPALGVPGMLNDPTEASDAKRVWYLFEEDWSTQHPTGIVGAGLESRAVPSGSAAFEGTQLLFFDSDSAN
jgi:4-amino-4-deoxy-L-arabinose transferase-like glycosyltransferase